MGTYFYNSAGGYHTDDLSLIQTSVKIAPPAQRTKFLEVPYRNGLIDLTEFFGGVTYGNREITWSFTVKPDADYIAVRNQVEEFLHCQEMNIIFDDEADKVYHGRVTVESYERDKVLMIITVKASCDPTTTDIEFTITQQPEDITATSGSNAVFTISTSIIAGVSYQWQYSTDGSSFYNTSAAGNKTAALTIPATSTNNGRYYRCIVTKGETTLTSEAGRLRVT